MAEMGYWLDHKGGMLGPGPLDNPTGYGKIDQLTHRIMRPQSGQLIQAVSWCGRRVHEVPGRGDVDCPKCLELIAEEEPGETPEERRYRELLDEAVRNGAVIG